MSEKTPTSTPTKTPEKKSKKNIVFLLIILLLCGIAGYLWVQLNKGEEKLETESFEKTQLEIDKKKIQEELEEVLAEYNTISTDNEEMQAKIDSQKVIIEKRLAELKVAKANDYLLKKYKEELDYLIDVMDEYVVTVDSLNTLTQELWDENYRISGELTDANEEKGQLKTELDNIVALGSVLKVDNFVVKSLKIKKSGKETETTKASRTELLSVCFNISVNKITQPGDKVFYLRIIHPNGKVISNSKSNVFDFEGVSGLFTIKRTIPYNNTMKNACITWEAKDAELKSGRYIIELYESGTKIASKNLDLR